MPCLIQKTDTPNTRNLTQNTPRYYMATTPRDFLRAIFLNYFCGFAIHILFNCYAP